MMIGSSWWCGSVIATRSTAELRADVRVTSLPTDLGTETGVFRVKVPGLAATPRIVGPWSDADVPGFDAGAPYDGWGTDEEAGSVRA